MTQEPAVEPPGRQTPVGADGRAPAPLTILCEECGEIVEVKVPAEVVRALHLTNECPAVSGLFSATD